MLNQAEDKVSRKAAKEAQSRSVSLQLLYLFLAPLRETRP